MQQSIVFLNIANNYKGNKIHAIYNSIPNIKYLESI